MGMPRAAAEGTYKYGKGRVHVLRHDPKEYVLTPGGDRKLIDAVEQAYGRLEMKNSFRLDRGPYTLVAVLDENMVSDKPVTVKGCLIDLFDPELPVMAEKTVRPGEQAFLFDMSRVKDRKRPQVLAAASRQYDERRTANSYSFTSKSPANTSNVMRVFLPAKPKDVTVTGAGRCDWSWDDGGMSTGLLKFENNPDGVRVDIKW